MKNFSLALLASVAFILVVLLACSDDNEEDIGPQPQQCDTSTVTFASTVTPILSANCYSCHKSSIAEGGVMLDTYAGVKKEVDEGYLIGVITHAPGFQPMPKGGSKLSDCNIAKIRKWVDAGAPNN